MIKKYIMPTDEIEKVCGRCKKEIKEPVFFRHNGGWTCFCTDCAQELIKYIDEQVNYHIDDFLQ